MRYFDKTEGEMFDRLLNEALAEESKKFPSLRHKTVYDGLQYEDVAYTLYPGIQEMEECYCLILEIIKQVLTLK